MYSEDSELNFEINRMAKNTWTRAMTGSGLSNAVSFLFLASYMAPDMWIGTIPYAIYIALQSLPAVFLLAGFFYMSARKKKLLEKNREPVYIDDDIYWKNGWYSNPNDRRLLVQDWVCSWNYTTNMARPAGKICMAAGLIVTAVCLVAMCVIMVYIEFTPLQVELGGECIRITSGYYDTELDYDEITEVNLLDALPEDEYRKVSGFSDDRQMVGKFRGKETGSCIMILWRDCTPVLEIRTEDGPVYMNSTEDGQTEQWMEEISIRLEGKYGQ